GIVEIAIAVMIGLRSWSALIAAVGSAMAVVMSLTTLSFLFSTPGWEPTLGGFPGLSAMPGQFLLKDLVLLGAAVWSLGEALSVVTGLLGFLGRRSSLLPSSGLRRLLERHIDFERVEDAAIPLHVIGVDLKSGRERRLSEGDVIEAVLASAAMPAVFPPVRWGDLELIDGGVANNTPISHAIELGATEIYVLPTGYACHLHTAPRSALGMGLHALTLLI